MKCLLWVFIVFVKWSNEALPIAVEIQHDIEALQDHLNLNVEVRSIFLHPFKDMSIVTVVFLDSKHVFQVQDPLNWNPGVCQSLSGHRITAMIQYYFSVSCLCNPNPASEHDRLMLHIAGAASELHLADKVIYNPDESLVSGVLRPIWIANALGHIRGCQGWECIGVGLYRSWCIGTGDQALQDIICCRDSAGPCIVHWRRIDTPCVVKRKRHTNGVEAQHPALLL